MQTRLRSGVAVAVPGSCSSNLTPSVGTSICCRCGPKKEKRKEGRKREREREGKRERKKKKTQISQEKTIKIIC